MMALLKGFKICFLIMLGSLLLMPGMVADAQIQVGNDMSEIDYSLPREYEIGGITVSGVEYVDPAVVVMQDLVRHIHQVASGEDAVNDGLAVGIEHPIALVVVLIGVFHPDTITVGIV